MTKQPQPSGIDPELEARIVAMVLGEASDFERGELDRLIDERPELAALKKKIQSVHGLLRDVVTGESVAADDDWKLSAERRGAVLAVIGGEAEGMPAKADAVESFKLSKSANDGFLWKLSKIAAVFCVVGLIGALLLPASQSAKMAARRTKSSDRMQPKKLGIENHFRSELVSKSLSGGDSAASRESFATNNEDYYFEGEAVAVAEPDYEANSKSALSAIRGSLNYDAVASADFGVDSREPRRQQKGKQVTERPGATASSPVPAAAAPSTAALDRFGEPLGGIAGEPGDDSARLAADKNGDEGAVAFDVGSRRLSSSETDPPKAGDGELTFPGLAAGRTNQNASVSADLAKRVAPTGSKDIPFRNNSFGTNSYGNSGSTASEAPEGLDISGAQAATSSDSSSMDIDALIELEDIVASRGASSQRRASSTIGKESVLKEQSASRRSATLDAKYNGQEANQRLLAEHDMPRESEGEEYGRQLSAQPEDQWGFARPSSKQWPATAAIEDPDRDGIATEDNMSRGGGVGGGGGQGGGGEMSGGRDESIRRPISEPEAENGGGQFRGKQLSEEAKQDSGRRFARNSEEEEIRMGEQGFEVDVSATVEDLVANQPASSLSEPATHENREQLQKSLGRLSETSKPNVNRGEDLFSADESTEIEGPRDEQRELLRRRSQLAAAGRVQGRRTVLDRFDGTDKAREKARVITRAAPAELNEKTAEDEAFSTFSLHVSDVSFKLARAALAKGEWPEAAKVRIEEFVNAFDYGDPLPSRNEKVACRLEQSIHPFLQQRNLLRVSLRTAAAGRASTTPLRLTLVLDNSGSMERVDRRETVRRAFALLAEQLAPVDQVTLISFARRPRLLADKVRGAQVSQLVQQIQELPSEGGTNIEAALQLAFEKAQEQQVENAQNRIILLTDGAVNLGDAQPESLSRMIASMRSAGIAFDAAGISAEGLNDEILEALTRQGDGRYYLLDSPADADDGFARQIAGALRPSAKNVKVQIEFNPRRVGRYKLLGFEKHRLKQEDFRNDQVDAAEMAAAEAGVALYTLESKANGAGDIGQVSVRFRDLSTGQMVENRWPIPYEADAPRADQATPSLRIATSAALLAAKFKGGPLGHSVDLRTLSELLAGLPDRHCDSKRVQQLQQMLQQARQLSAK